MRSFLPGKKIMNDKAYEQELDTLQQEMLLVLDELHNDLGREKS